MPAVTLAPHSTLLVRSTFDDTAVRRACHRGALVRLTAGRYLRSPHWQALDARDRHVMFCLAALSCLSTPVVVSHASAAAFWGLPRLGEWPTRAHVIDPVLVTGTSGRYVQRHAARLDDLDIVEKNGVAVTSLARTALDLAISATPRQAVVALDHALRAGVTAADLRDRLARRSSTKGARKARWAIDFADARANRPGESLSRVVMHEGGFAAPELQKVFRGPRGQKAQVDFWWSEVGVIGEFDGDTKYRDSERWSGLSADEVVIREKNRENWLRAHPDVHGFVRWTWPEAYSPATLARLLSAAAVPLVA